MKSVISNYTFNKAAQTVTFNDFASVDAERLLMITNISAGRVVYLMNDAALGGSIAGNAVTLATDTSTMHDADKLQIFYEEAQHKVVQGDLSDTLDSVATRGKHTAFTGLAVSSAADLLPPTDVSSYSQIIVHLTTVSAGNFVQFAFSNDASVWSAYLVVGAASTYVLPRRGRYFKASVTTYATGTVEGNIALYATSTVQGAGKVSYPAPDYGNFMVMQDNAGNLAPLYSLAGIGDNASGNKPLGVALAGHDGANTSRLRYASVFKSGSTATGGDTALWTPAAGKKFRLLGFQLYLSANAAQAAAGTLAVKLRDGTASDIMSFDVFVPGSAGTAFGAGWTSGWVPIGPSGGLGFLSGSANRVLNINLAAALTAGRASVVAIGTEE